MGTAPSTKMCVQPRPDWWCLTMHGPVTLPRNNVYQCLKCKRHYVVPWHAASAGPEPSLQAWLESLLSRIAAFLQGPAKRAPQIPES